MKIVSHLRVFSSPTQYPYSRASITIHCPFSRQRMINSRFAVNRRSLVAAISGRLATGAQKLAAIFKATHFGEFFSALTSIRKDGSLRRFLSIICGICRWKFDAASSRFPRDPYSQRARLEEFHSNSLPIWAMSFANAPHTRVVNRVALPLYFGESKAAFVRHVRGLSPHSASAPRIINNRKKKSILVPFSSRQ